MDTSSQDPAPPPSNSGLNRFLMVAVVVMGVLLIGGVLTVIGTIVYRISTRVAANRLPDAATLSVDGPVKSMSLDGDRLALVFDGPAGEVAVIYDLARGREVMRITLEARPAP